MLLKTYRAPDLAAALAQARAELGPDALVLATSEVSGELGLTAVEVTVGSLRRRPEAATWGRAAAAESPPVRPPAPAGAPGAEAIEAAARALVASGVSEDLARRFARIASRHLPTSATTRRLAEAAESAIEEIVPLAPLPLRARCLFLVGPPGSGKTTTAAKLVARMAGSADRPVFFAAADMERVGAIEEADIYARHAGAILALVEGPEDLARALEDAGERGTVVVDTAGVGAKDAARLERLGALRESAPGAEVAVLLPAGLDRHEASRVLDRFAAAGPTCAAISRVDDGGRLGELVTAVAGAGVPLSFVTTGHRIPDDLETVSARSLALMLLSSARVRPGAMEAVP